VLRTRKEEFEQINASNAAHAARAASFSGLRKYLSDNKAAFMGELWDQLMALTSEFANQVTEGDITAVGRTEDGEFWMEEFGVRKPMIAASGGQKSICGVGLRMALPSLIPGGSRLILLDEPSAALTEEMSSSLAGALKAQDRQIVLVTHRSGEEYLSDVVVTLER
jgi:DNA repair exonuclease SbcCD ATPase subunit